MSFRPACDRAVGLILVILVSLAGLAVSPVHAQGIVAPGRNDCVPFDLPNGHWAIAAVRRLEGAGLASVQFTTRTLPACQALTIFAEASSHGAGGELGGFAALWAADLKEEYPRLLQFESESFIPVVAGTTAEIGVETRKGESAPGLAEFPPDRTGALALADRSIATGAGEVSMRFRSHLGGVAGVGLDVDGIKAERLEAIGALGPVSVTVGRGAIGYGFARGGSLLLSGTAPLDRVQLNLSAVAIPRPFPWLVNVSMGTFLGVVREDRQPGKPYLWGASGSIRPNSRMTFTLTRAALFGGGTTPGEKVTAQRILDMLLGKIDGGGFEDQLGSVEGIFRLPTEGVVPLTIFAEWGTEDLSGGAWEVPGFTVGVHVPVFPSAPELSGGFEYTLMAKSCCKNPEWYRHHSFPGSWTLGGEPLGHPLGGNGTQWLVFANFDAPTRMLTLEGSAFHRFYGSENLFVPGRDGASLGIEAKGQWRLLEQREIFGSIRAEKGDGWQATNMSVGGRLFLR